MNTPVVINLVTPSTIDLASPASCGSPGTASTLSSIGTWSEELGRHYNPTENWMLWTNRSYEPRRQNGRLRQEYRLQRWLQSENPFGY